MSKTPEIMKEVVFMITGTLSENVRLGQGKLVDVVVVLKALGEYVYQKIYGVFWTRLNVCFRFL